jgi:Recombinase
VVSKRACRPPGPEDEVRAVNDIYRWFIDDGLVESEIAGRLNGLHIRTDLGRDWTRATVHEVLTNEKYIGHNIYNRVSFKLKKLRVANPPDMWIRKEGAFDCIVPPDIFYTAQGIIRARARRYTDEELIERLRGLYRHRGFLSGLVINEAEGMPCAAVYAHRFGSLVRAYQLVGYTPDRDYRYVEINRLLRRMHPDLVHQVERQIADLGGSVKRDPATDMLLVNREFTVSVVLARCQAMEGGHQRWKLRLDTSLAPDISVAARLDGINQAIRDYYLLPRIDFGPSRISLAEQNAAELESYRFETLDYLYGMAARARLRVAA